MAHAEICPLCDGNGNKDGQPDNPGGTNKFCHGCGGRGWLEVADEIPYYIPPNDDSEYRPKTFVSL